MELSDVLQDSFYNLHLILTILHVFFFNLFPFLITMIVFPLTKELKQIKCEQQSRLQAETVNRSALRPSWPVSTVPVSTRSKFNRITFFLVDRHLRPLDSGYIMFKLFTQENLPVPVPKVLQSLKIPVVTFAFVLVT